MAIKAVFQVTAPLYKPALDVPFVITITSRIWLAPPLKRRSDAAEMEPPHLLRGKIYPEREVVAELIVTAVLKDILEENFPDDSYVGKSFQLTLHRQSTKRYNTWSVVEVEITDNPEPESEADQPVEKGKKK